MQQVFNKYTILNMSQQRVPTALGTEKVSKLLMQYAVPSIIAMTASSLYNMVDSIFIGQGVGAMAISGIAITSAICGTESSSSNRREKSSLLSGDMRSNSCLKARSKASLSIDSTTLLSSVTA